MLNPSCGGLFVFGCCFSRRLLGTHFFLAVVLYTTQWEGSWGLSLTLPHRVCVWWWVGEFFALSHGFGTGPRVELLCHRRNYLKKKLQCKSTVGERHRFKIRWATGQTAGNCWTCEQKVAEFQEVSNSPNRCCVWRSHKAGSGIISYQDQLSASVPVQPGAEQSGREGAAWEQQILPATQRGAANGTRWRIQSQKSGAGGSGSSHTILAPGCFLSRLGAGRWGELLFYFHFDNTGLSDFLGCSNMRERVICFISFHNLVLQKTKNKNMFHLIWLPEWVCLTYGIPDL